RPLHRQLSDAGARENSAPVRSAECRGQWTVGILSLRVARSLAHSWETPMPKRLDLVLINPASRTQVYQSLGTKLAAVENPVWAGLMATFCRRCGLSVEIIDAEAEELVAEEVAERVEELKPVVAAVVVYGHQPS